MAKAICWDGSDGEGRNPGERAGLDTPVVLGVNDAHCVGEATSSVGAEAKALSAPPGEYGRKTET